MNYTDYMEHQRNERETEEFAAGHLPVWLAQQTLEDDGLPTPISGDATLIKKTTTTAK